MTARGRHTRYTGPARTVISVISAIVLLLVLVAWCGTAYSGRSFEYSARTVTLIFGAVLMTTYPLGIIP
jgi:hypothetical protein